MNELKLDTADEVRDFLKLCLDPGPDRAKRTVTQLAKVMPQWMRDRLAVHAPELEALRAEADRLETEAAKARRVYAKALGSWIKGGQS